MNTKTITDVISPIISPSVGGAFYLVNYCACGIMQVSKEIGVKMEDKNNMNKLRPNSCGGGKLLRLLSQITKSRGKIVTSAPAAPTASHNLAPAADSQANYKNLLAGGLARGVVFSALALAITPFISTAPVYAADDNTVSIAVDQNATLKPSGHLYKATTNVTVKTDKLYGFNLTMQADTADLVNAKDSTHKIYATPSSTPVALNANQWGYSLNKSASTFSAVPAGAQATPAVIVDTAVKGK